MKANAIATAVIELILGLFIFMRPEATGSALMSMLGTFILLFGIIHIVSFLVDHEIHFSYFQLVMGIAAAVVGLLFLTRPMLLAGFISLILALFIIAGSINELERAIRLREFGYSQWWLAAMVAVITLFLGISLILFPGFYGEMLMRAIGIFLMVEAISDLLTIHRITLYTRS